MTARTRKELKSRSTRGLLENFLEKSTGTSLPVPCFLAHGLTIGGEVGCTRKKGKVHRTNLSSVTNGCFSEGIGTGEKRGKRPDGTKEVKATKILGEIGESMREKRGR